MPQAAIKVKASNEAAFSVDANTESDTVADLKQKIADALAARENERPEPSGMRLIFAGKVLKDTDLLSVYKLQDGQTVHMVRGSKPPAATSSTPASAAPTPSQPASTTSPTTQQQPSQPANPFASLGGAGGFPGMFGGGFPGMPGAMPPNMMEQMMSDPNMATMISQMMSNPQVLDAMIAMNPQLANVMTPEMRQIFQSEEFRSMMSNPQMIQMLMQMSPMMGGAGMPGGAGGFGAMMGGAGTAGAQNPSTAATSGAAAGAQPSAATFPPLPTFNPALMQMMMAANANRSGGVPGARSARPPEELYQTQLQQLRDMGFFDPAENVRALTLTGGNVEAAIEWLFSHPPGAR